MTFFNKDRKSENPNNESFSEIIDEAEEHFGRYEQERREEEREMRRLEEMDIFKEKPEVREVSDFFSSNLGANRDKFGMEIVGVTRHSPFQWEYGDPEQNPFAYMLEDLEDEVDVLLERLREINRNLDREIY